MFVRLFFSNHGLMARVDILEVSSNGWNIIEVKSSVSLKQDHVWDVAIQKYVLEKCGGKIKKCFIMYLNKECTYPHLDDLFIKKNVTEEVGALQEKVEELTENLKKILNQEKVPKKNIGPYCQKPYPCRFISHCWKKIPSPNVFKIPGIGEKSWEHYENNQVKLKDVPLEDLSERQRVYRYVHLENKSYVDKKNIKKEMIRWRGPFYFLDFETISFPIPKFEAARPFQHIPFQFSLLKQNFFPNFKDEKNLTQEKNSKNNEYF